MPHTFGMGKDHSLTITTSRGALRPVNLQGFTYRQDTVDTESRPLNGRKLNRSDSDGWSGSFTVDRSDDTIDEYFSRKEETDAVGGQPDQIMITETIKEIDGRVSQYQFSDVTLRYEDAGDRSQNTKVTQRVAFTAARRRKVA